MKWPKTDRDEGLLRDEWLIRDKVHIKLCVFRFINIQIVKLQNTFQIITLALFLHENPENNEALHRRGDIFCGVGVTMARLWVAFSCFLGSAIQYIYFEIICPGDILFKHSLLSVSHC